MTNYLALFDAEKAKNPGSFEKDGVGVTDDLLNDAQPIEFVGVDSERAINVSTVVGQPLKATPPVDDSPLEGPCHPWCSIEDLSEDCRDSIHARWAVQFASFIMWSESGRQYGVCERVEQPCGNTYNCICGCCRGPQIRVPGPIAGIIEIVENGERWDLSRVRRYGRNFLELTNRGDCWPCTNDYSRSPYQLDAVQSNCPPPAAEACPNLPKWAADELDRYGLTPTRETTATDVVGRIFELHPEIAYASLTKPTRPAWVERYLTENDLSVVWGRCGTCRDEFGRRCDEQGRKYTCFGTHTHIQSGDDISMACCSAGEMSTACSCRPHVVAKPCGTVEPETILIKGDISESRFRHLLEDQDQPVELMFTAPKEETQECFLKPVAHSVGPAQPSDYLRPKAPSRAFTEANVASQERYTGHAWLVRYWQGRVVPHFVREITAEFACQLIAAREGRDCLLNDDLRTLVRGNVQATFEKTTSRKDRMHGTVTGFGLVDSWLAQVNPHKLRRRARVISPSDYSRAGSRSV